MLDSESNGENIINPKRLKCNVDQATTTYAAASPMILEGHQMGSKMWMTKDLTAAKMLEAEHLAKLKVKKTRRNEKASSASAEILLEEAYIQHQQEIKNLLVASSKAGLKSVPEDAINPARAKNFRSMRSANAALIEARSPKALVEKELMQKLKHVELDAVQWHISERLFKRHNVSVVCSGSQQYTGQKTMKMKEKNIDVEDDILCNMIIIITHV